jgi:hypothetical protein
MCWQQDDVWPNRLGKAGAAKTDPRPEGDFLVALDLGFQNPNVPHPSRDGDRGNLGRSSMPASVKPKRNGGSSSLSTACAKTQGRAPTAGARRKGP